MDATRDLAEWPFDVCSPWNMPIGEGASFAEVDGPVWKSDTLKYGLLINSTEWTIPVYVAKASDPLRKIYRDDGNPTTAHVEFTAHVPDAAKPDPAGDAHLHIVDETHQQVIEMLSVFRRSDGELEAPFPNIIDLRGSGIFDSYHGSCAYGGSCTAGLIRKGELTQGIHHALRMAISPASLNPEGPVWPAVTHEDNYTCTGCRLHMGSLLAIPGDVNLSTIAGAAGSSSYLLAKALQDYGAYVVDRGHLNLYVEPSAADEAATLDWALLQEIPKYLQVVSNNSATSVGGGGKPRQCLAPPVH